MYTQLIQYLIGLPNLTAFKSVNRIMKLERARLSITPELTQYIACRALYLIICRALSL